jgi:hypothetical protein
MATVNVSSWAEFKTAVAVAGDTVNLPEKAVWDMNEIQPQGVNGLNFACAEVNGNGTEIKNLWMLNIITVGCPINNLKLTNTVFKNCGANYAIGTGGNTLSGCVFSAICESDFSEFMQSSGSGSLILCSAHVELAKSGNLSPFEGYNLTGCRITIDAPNGGTLRLQHTGGNKAKNCEFIVNSAACTGMYIGYWDSCTLRGELPNCDGLYAYDGMGSISVYCADDIPASTVIGITGVTEAQMQSVSYLQGIGFTVKAGVT